MKKINLYIQSGLIRSFFIPHYTRLGGPKDFKDFWWTHEAPLDKGERTELNHALFIQEKKEEQK
jgi:hypothetical protein